MDKLLRTCLVWKVHDGHDRVPSHDSLKMHWVSWWVVCGHGQVHVHWHAHAHAHAHSGLHARLKAVVGYALHPNHVQHLQGHPGDPQHISAASMTRDAHMTATLSRPRPW